MKNFSLLTIIFNLLIVLSTMFLPIACSDDGSDGEGGIDGGNNVEPLTWVEEELVGKWGRYHAYDDSYMYYIFNSDRTACYFEVAKSSQTHMRCYDHWELVDEDNNNVYDIIFDGNDSKSNYRYIEDEIWYGGYSNLKMGHSSTSRDCDCDF